MKEYIERFNRSYQDAVEFKQEIYSLPIKEYKKDEIWERIIFFCIEMGMADWYFDIAG